MKGSDHRVSLKFTDSPWLISEYIGVFEWH